MEPPIPNSLNDDHPSSASFHVGQKLGPFQLMRELGRGGMGIVFEAEDVILHRKVAIKILPIQFDPGERSRWKHEARAAAKVDHPHVVRLLQVGRHRGHYFLVLELMTGGTLKDRLATRRLSWSEATQFLVDACQGVVAAHAVGLIHRDLKPANFMLDGEGVVKVADFGLARHEDVTHSMVAKMAGTPRYMSPEQCRGEPADERSDVYSLGITYFELLTGRPPYTHTTAAQVMLAHCSLPLPDPWAIQPDIPPTCVAVLQRATAKEPAARFQSAQELLDALLKAGGATIEEPIQSSRRSSQKLPIVKRSSSSTKPVDARPRSTRRNWLLLGGGVVASLIGGVIVWNRWPTSKPTPKPVEPLVSAEHEWTLNGAITSVAISPRGEWVAAGTAEGGGGAVVWDGQRKEIKTRLNWGPVHALMFFHPTREFPGLTDSLQLIGGGPRGPMIWFAENNQDGNFIIDFEWDGGLGTLRTAANKQRVITALGYDGGSLSGTVKQYLHGNSAPDCRGGFAGVRQLTYALDARDHRLAVVYTDGELAIFDSRSGQRRATGPKELTVAVVAFVSNDVLAVAVGREVRFWSEKLTEVFPTLTFSSTITSMAATADGQRLAVGQDDGHLALVAMENSAVVRATWSGHTGRVLALTFAADGTWFVSGGDDRAVRRWDVAVRLHQGVSS